jgi:stage II sporulation protein D
MKKFLITTVFVVTFFALSAVSASAVTNGMVKVGLKYGGDALFSANLENAVGGGYSFGYYDSSRNFVTLGATAQTKLSMTASGTIYVGASGAYYATEPVSSHSVIGTWHIQLGTDYPSFDAAAAAAAAYSGGYPCYISGAFYVRIGSYSTSSDASSAMGSLGVSGTAVSSGSTGVTVTVTGTTTVLFEFDCQGAQSLGVLPNGQGSGAVTWFKGYKYFGGFEYARITGGNLNVINVLDLEDYVKGVVPYEMTGTWPTEALKAQAICARTYVCGTTKHLSSYGFDVCNTVDCQVYYGAGNASIYPTQASDSAVEETAGKCLYYNGALIEAVYFSSDGGATESAENVWGSPTGYLIGKPDPYEATVSIPNYSYTVTYTPAQLTWVLQNSGYSIGTVCNAYVSEYTQMGNVYKVTFVDTSGNTLTMKGDKCRSAFYSTTYGKSVRSMRFKISGGSSAAYYVNSASSPLNSLSGASVISGGGTVSACPGSGLYVITSSGTAALSSSASASGSGGFTITGTGNGHNVGMSQYGAYAMALQGNSCQEILNFYYTDVTIG